MVAFNLGAGELDLENPAGGLAALYQSYKPIPGVSDEFMAADGTINPRWRLLLDNLTAADLRNARTVSERHIRDFGLFYRTPSENQERLWPISELPLLLAEDEWQTISAGLVQRAEVLERMLSDVYGPNDLVQDQVIPAALVGGNPEFIRQVHGSKPAGGKWIRIYAADLGRGPDGQWWVLKDRAQAPAGLGYVIENRLAVSRAYPLSYQQMNVRRIAPFFRAFRNGLMSSAARTQPRICLMSPGRYSPNYSEHSYLARYLGFLLVEGDDLVVHNGFVHVKTIAGLKRADVLWRHLAAEYLDPLELFEGSRLGVPGLMSVTRSGQAVIANAPGAGFVESRALLGFLPTISDALIGEQLSLPNIATWWCGEDSARTYVLDNIDNLMISSAFGRYMPGFDKAELLVPRQMQESERKKLIEAIKTRGVDYVAQEIAQLSTMPVVADNRIEPRPFVLRVYVCATQMGWQVLPGGLCLISDHTDSRIVNMSTSIHSADVWVMSSKEVAVETLLADESNVPIRRILGNLPSRAADNLFWFGRYVERAEAVLRIVKTLCAKSIETDMEQSNAADTLWRLSNMLVSWSAVPIALANNDASAVATGALFSTEMSGSVISTLGMVRGVATAIRERMSIDTWKLVNTLDSILNSRAQQEMNSAAIVDLCDEILISLAAISGLGQENTNRVAGWRFREIGRRTERAINTCRFIRQFGGSNATPESLDALLDLIESQITFRSRYLIAPAAVPIRDLAFLDPFNPRSVAFQIEQIQTHLATLPTLVADGVAEAPTRILASISGEISSLAAQDVAEEGVFNIEQRLCEFANTVAMRYFLPRLEGMEPKKISGLA